MTRKCVICKKAFEVGHPRQRSCGRDECRKKLHSLDVRKWQQRHKNGTAKTSRCQWCGMLIVSGDYCNDGCRKQSESYREHLASNEGKRV